MVILEVADGERVTVPAAFRTAFQQAIAADPRHTIIKVLPTGDPSFSVYVVSGYSTQVEQLELDISKRQAIAIEREREEILAAPEARIEPTRDQVQEVIGELFQQNIPLESLTEQQRARLRLALQLRGIEPPPEVISPIERVIREPPEPVPAPPRIITPPPERLDPIRETAIIEPPAPPFFQTPEQLGLERIERAPFPVEEKFEPTRFIPAELGRFEPAITPISTTLELVTRPTEEALGPIAGQIATGLTVGALVTVAPVAGVAILGETVLKEVIRDIGGEVKIGTDISKIVGITTEQVGTVRIGEPFLFEPIPASKITPVGPTAFERIGAGIVARVQERPLEFLVSLAVPAARAFITPRVTTSIDITAVQAQQVGELQLIRGTARIVTKRKPIIGRIKTFETELKTFTVVIPDESLLQPVLPTVQTARIAGVGVGRTTVGQTVAKEFISGTKGVAKTLVDKKLTTTITKTKLIDILEGKIPGKEAELFAIAVQKEIGTFPVTITGKPFPGVKLLTPVEIELFKKIGIAVTEKGAIQPSVGFVAALKKISTGVTKITTGKGAPSQLVSTQAASVATALGKEFAGAAAVTQPLVAAGLGAATVGRAAVAEQKAVTATIKPILEQQKRTAQKTAQQVMTEQRQAAMAVTTIQKQDTKRIADTSTLIVTGLSRALAQVHMPLTALARARVQTQDVLRSTIQAQAAQQAMAQKQLIRQATALQLKQIQLAPLAPPPVAPTAPAAALPFLFPFLRLDPGEARRRRAAFRFILNPVPPRIIAPKVRLPKLRLKL